MRVVGIALLLAFVTYLLRDLGWRGVPVFISIASVLIIGAVFEPLSEVIGGVESVSDAQLTAEALSVATKALGLTYLFGISSDVCESMGEKSIAKALEVVGRVEIIAIAMPYFTEVIKIGVELIA